MKLVSSLSTQVKYGDRFAVQSPLEGAFFPQVAQQISPPNPMFCYTPDKEHQQHAAIDNDKENLKPSLGSFHHNSHLRHSTSVNGEPHIPRNSDALLPLQEVSLSQCISTENNNNAVQNSRNFILHEANLKEPLSRRVGEIESEISAAKWKLKKVVLRKKSLKSKHNAPKKQPRHYSSKFKRRNEKHWNELTSSTSNEKLWHNEVACPESHTDFNNPFIYGLCSEAIENNSNKNCTVGTLSTTILRDNETCYTNSCTSAEGTDSKTKCSISSNFIVDGDKNASRAKFDDFFRCHWE